MNTYIMCSSRNKAPNRPSVLPTILKLRKTIEDGSALKKLAEFVAAQGGNPEAVYDPSLLPQAHSVWEIKAPRDGYIEKIICDEVGMVALMLGGGRETKESAIDLSVGMVLAAKVGDYVKAGTTLARIYADCSTSDAHEKAKAAQMRFLKAYRFSAEPVVRKELIKTIIR